VCVFVCVYVCVLRACVDHVCVCVVLRVYVVCVWRGIYMCPGQLCVCVGENGVSGLCMCVSAVGTRACARVCLCVSLCLCLCVCVSLCVRVGVLCT
jgi:hypothetical protein